jgi:N-carbamoyl-L-amino-acid hydrolase
VSIRLSSDRIWAGVEALSKITDPDRPFTRRAFSDAYKRGRTWLQETFSTVGLSPRVDTAGNLIGRHPGTQDWLPATALGSHSDTVISGGRFDGIAGVVVAIEVARAIAEHKLVLERPLEIIDFLAEEPSDYGLSCVGSRGLSGGLTDEMLQMRNLSGETLADGIRRMGGDPGKLARGYAAGGGYHAFLELHIEQAPRLERAKKPIGVVTRFAGIQRTRLIVTGRTDHAGTTLMGERLDALVGAAEIVQIVQKLAVGEGGRGGFVATIGQLQVRPGAANAIPGEVELTLEVRSLEEADSNSFMDRLLAEGRALLEPRGFRFTLEAISRVAPTACSSEMQDLLVRVVEGRGLPYLLLSSGAGHDAMHMARICPSGMIFVPSREGRSHCPEEYTSPEDLRVGAEVLLDAVMLLDRPDPMLNGFGSAEES